MDGFCMHFEAVALPHRALFVFISCFVAFVSCALFELLRLLLFASITLHSLQFWRYSLNWHMPSLSTRDYIQSLCCQRLKLCICVAHTNKRWHPAQSSRRKHWALHTHFLHGNALWLPSTNRLLFYQHHPLQLAWERILQELRQKTKIESLYLLKHS